jgi:hypothetical protein
MAAPAWGREDGVICLECLLAIPCDCPPGTLGRADAAAVALRGMSTKEVVILFRKVIAAASGPDGAAVFDIAVQNRPRLRCVGGRMLASRVFASALQTIIKETLTDDVGDEGMTQMVGQMLHEYTQALCAAVQPLPVVPAAPQAAPAPAAHHPPPAAASAVHHTQPGLKDPPARTPPASPHAEAGPFRGMPEAGVGGVSHPTRSRLEDPPGSTPPASSETGASSSAAGGKSKHSTLNTKP